MHQNICNICGANYEYRNGRWKCPACGAYKAEELSNEEVTLLYSAAQKLRLSDFDEAEKAYSDIVEKYPRNPEGYWGRLLSKYGIKYEEDFDGRKIPTCYAASIESVISDKDFAKATSLADANTRVYYQQQAQYIERVRKEWIDKAQKEPPYDIFICYKDSDLANGVERTTDSIAVQELYIHLIKQGYKVFFSRECLRDKVGEKYEPYIFNALSSAKAMIVYGSSSDYITSTWLKNEWTRYQKRIQNGEKKPNSLIVAYDGFSPSELPRVLSSMQCMDARDRSFYSDLDEILKRIIKDEENPLPNEIQVDKVQTRKKKRKILPTMIAAVVATLAIFLFVGVFNSTKDIFFNNVTPSVTLNSKTTTTARPTTTTKPTTTTTTTNSSSVIPNSALENLKDGETVVLDKSIIIDQLNVDTTGDYGVDLNNYTLTLDGGVKAINEGSKLIISNGIINSDDSSAAILSQYGAYLEINNMQVNALTATKTIDCYGGTMVLNNVTVSQPSYANYYTFAIRVIHGFGDNAKYNAHLTVNSGSYTGMIALQVSSTGGTVIINGGTFTGTEAIHMDCTDSRREHLITINGGIFNGSIYAAVGSKIIVNGGTFTVDISTVANVTISEGKKVVNNGDGTWTVVALDDTNATNKNPTSYSQGLEYTLNADGKSYSVTGIGTCTDTNLLIPSHYNELPVTNIAEKAFDEVSSFTSISFGAYINNISYDAFDNCSSLSNVYYDGDLSDWCNIEFGNPSSNPLYNGANLYIQDELVKDIVIPDSVTTIHNYAFYKCTSLTSVVIPDSVTSVGSWAFYQCNSIKSVVIGNCVEDIGSAAFSNCTSLNNLTIGNSVKDIGVSAFASCSRLESVVIPDSVTSMGNFVFRYCSSLSSVTIGNSMASMGYGAFTSCSSLNSVVFEETSGWWYTSNYSATSGTSISSTSLENSLTAAQYLKSTYRDSYWRRSE